MTEIIPIQYRFTFTDSTSETFNLQLDSRTLDLFDNLPQTLPAWTALEFQQCPHCSLTPATHAACPLAARIAGIISRFDRFPSYKEVHLEVVTLERVISHGTTIQRAIGSLLGLVIAASGCPHTVFFRPMARFHLPLASEEETIYRAATMYLLAQYYRRENGAAADFSIEGLTEIYRKVQTVNVHVAKRFRGTCDSDSGVNAIVYLDMYAKSMPYAVRESLSELRYLFAAFF
jgi:hypothetical protein